jgi:ribonuclease R
MSEPEGTDDLPSDATILAALPPPPRSAHLRDLARFLSLSEEGRRALRERLRGLADAGRIQRERGNRYGRPRAGAERIGTLTMTARGFGFVSAEGGGEDIFVAARNVGVALHRDRVRVRVEENDGRRDGVITGVVERGTTTFVGTYRAARRGAWVTPQDPRLGEQYSVEEGGGAKDGDLVAATFLRWPDDDLGAVVRVLRVLAVEGDAARETDVIVYDLGLPLEFSAEAEAEATAARPPGPRALVGRTDLRPRALVTCDPESAKDFDDAIWAEPRTHGGWSMTVAIADVGAYVTEGGPLDAEARARGTSVYLPDRVLPMLPHALSGDLCSLRPDEDRLALAVDLEIGPDGEVERSNIYEAVIRSHARFTYERVARMLGIRSKDDTPAEDPDPHFEGLRSGLEALLDASRALRHFRRRRGYLDLDLAEPKILLDANGDVADIVAAERNEAHRLVEECMLAANEAVARSFVEGDLPAVFRVHDRPVPRSVSRLEATAAAFGAPLRTKGTITPSRLSTWLRGVDAHDNRRILHQLMLRTMAVAAYDEEPGLHFGLGAEEYLHFTSPIRRYPDLIVHRLVKARLHGEALPNADALGVLADHCSRRERIAVDAERSVQDLYKALYIRRHLGESFDALVLGVHAIGLFVQLDAHMVEGLVPAGSLKDDLYTFDEASSEYRGRRSGARFGIGARVRVRVEAVDTRRRRVEFAMESLLTTAPTIVPLIDSETRSVKGESRRGRSRS